jgi:protein O-mannosyl-transferase
MISFEKQVIQVRMRTSVSQALALRMLAGTAIIIAATFLAYFPSLSGGFIWDDNDLYLTKNPIIKAPDGLLRFWNTTEPWDYYPLSNSSLWIEWRLWEMNPTGYHFTNLILHIAEALLIWIILRKLAIPGGFLAAIIFALHPVNVESVAWIAQRKDMLAVLFFLLSILWFLRFVKPAPRPTFGRCPLAAKQITDHCPPSTAHCPPSTAHCPPSTVHFFSWYCLSFLAFVLAMLSKGSVAILPVLLLGIILWRRPLTKGDLLRILPFFAVAATLTVVNVWFQRHGSDVAIRSADFAERILGAGGVVWFYFYKAILPINLVFVYPQWHIQTGNLLWWLPLAAMLGVTVVFFLFRKSWSRPFWFAWAFFCVALVPVMGFTDIYFMKYSLVADHYQHIAILGVITLLTACFSVWRSHAGISTRRAADAVAVAAVGMLMLLTWQQSEHYRDEITLYQATLEKNPACWMAQNNLGIALEIEGKPQLAIEHYRQALQLNPDFPDAQVNLGKVLFETGRLQESIEHYQQALALDPTLAAAHNNLGAILIEAGRPQEAVDHYNQALKLKPDFPEVYNNLGNLMYGKGQMQEAIRHFRKALNLRYDYPDAHYNLGVALAQIGLHSEAIEHYEHTLRLQPGHVSAHNNLGGALLKQGQLQEAIKHYQRAVELNPDFIDAYYNLALVYASIQHSSQAMALAHKALELAQSQGNMALAGQIGDWLNSYRAGLSVRLNMPPSSMSVSKSPDPSE